MARSTYVYREGLGVIDVREAPPRPDQRSGLAAPMVISDHCAPLRSMADGRVYDSKSAHARAARDAGCTIVGNDKAPFDRRPDYRPEGVGHDIKRALQELSR